MLLTKEMLRNSGEMQAMACDLGGTYFRSGVVDANGRLQHIKKERTPNFLGGHDSNFLWRDLFSRIYAYERMVSSTLARQAPVIVAFPGPIGSHRHILQAPTMLGSATDFPDVCAELEERLNRPVYLINDVSAAAFHLSTETLTRRFMVVTVSSGIGSKIYDRETAAGVIDDPPYAGEIGHIVVDTSPEALTCDCGAIGHLGAIASGRGVERTARKQAKLHGNEFAHSQCARRFGGSPENLSNECHIVPAICAGDEWAISVLKSSTRPLALSLLSVAIGAGIEKIIVIGGFALVLGSIYLQILRSLIAEASKYSVVSPLLPELVHLGRASEETCLQGAATYAHKLLAGNA